MFLEGGVWRKSTQTCAEHANSTHTKGPGNISSKHNERFNQQKHSHVIYAVFTVDLTPDQTSLRPLVMPAVLQVQRLETDSSRRPFLAWSPSSCWKELGLVEAVPGRTQAAAYVGVEGQQEDGGAQAADREAKVVDLIGKSPREALTVGLDLTEPLWRSDFSGFLEFLQQDQTDVLEFAQAMKGIQEICQWYFSLHKPLKQQLWGEMCHYFPKDTQWSHHTRSNFNNNGWFHHLKTFRMISRNYLISFS